MRELKACLNRMANGNPTPEDVRIGKNVAKRLWYLLNGDDRADGELTIYIRDDLSIAAEPGAPRHDSAGMGFIVLDEPIRFNFPVEEIDTDVDCNEAVDLAIDLLLSLQKVLCKEGE